MPFCHLRKNVRHPTLIFMSDEKPRDTAIALSYEFGDALPKILATGRGKLAEQIVQIAFERGIKVRQDPDLAQMLATLDIDAEIPIDAIEAVAEILAYVYRENGKMAELKKHVATQTPPAAPSRPASSATLASRPGQFREKPRT